MDYGTRASNYQTHALRGDEDVLFPMFFSLGIRLSRQEDCNTRRPCRINEQPKHGGVSMVHDNHKISTVDKDLMIEKGPQSTFQGYGSDFEQTSSEDMESFLAR